MAVADQYLYDGERILASFTVKQLELAATDSRIIRAQPGQFSDVAYGSLVSVGYGPVYKPGLAYAAFILTAVAIAFGWMASLVPRSLPFGPFSLDLGGLVSLFGFPAVAFGLLAVTAAGLFLATARRGITLRTPGGTFVLTCGRDDVDKALAFVKAVRAASAHRLPAW